MGDAVSVVTDAAGTLAGGAADFMTSNPAGMAISGIATGGMSGMLGPAGSGVASSLGQGAMGLSGGGLGLGYGGASSGFLSGLSSIGNSLWDNTIGGLGTPTEAFPGAGLGSGATNYSFGNMASNLGSSIMSNPMGAINQAGKLTSMFGGGVTPNIQNPGTGGSNQTTSSLNAYNWNNVPTSNNYTQGNMYSQLPTDINGKSILTDGKNQGNSSSTTQVTQPYGTYLGTL